MPSFRHLICFVCIACAFIAGCSRHSDRNSPLAYVPADTPYVYANLAPPPKAVSDQWSARMQDYLPAILSIYEDALDRIKKKQAKAPDPSVDRALKLARFFLEEVKTHDNWDKLRRIGLKPDALFAFYGIGMTPVIRLQLADAAAFKAEIARIEHKSGEKLPLGNLDKHDYWHVGNDKLQVLIAVVNKQLVVTLAPTRASDALKRRLLGLTRPKLSMADGDDLSGLVKTYRYSPYGEGFIDFTRIVTHLTGPAKGADLEIARLLGLPTAGADTICQTEYRQIASKFPRLVGGVRQLGAKHIELAAQIEMEPGLAKKLMSTLGAAPGSGSPGEGIVDIGVSLPLLQLKDFWDAQADAVSAKPFACRNLVGLNESFAKLKSKLSITIPPPFSDMTGMRFVLDKLTLRSHRMPDITGRWLFATSNPKADLAMAQLTLPALKNFNLAADGKSVALPTGVAPRGFPPLFAAMSDKAIAIGAGAGEQTTLGSFLTAKAADEPVFFRMHFNGEFYGFMADFMQKTAAKMPTAEIARRFQAQAKVFTIYEKWFRSGELSLTANERGIALQETIEQN